MLNEVLIALMMQCCAEVADDGHLTGDYPRLGMYTELRSNGTPFRSGTTIDEEAIGIQAMWDWATFDMTGDPGDAPANDNRAVLQLIRAANPTMRMMAFTQGHTLFACASGSGLGWWWDAGCGSEGVPPNPWTWEASCGACAAGGEGCLPVGCDTTGASFVWTRVKVARAFNAMLYSLTRDRNNDSRMDAFATGLGNSPVVNWAVPGFAEAMAESIADWAQRLDGVYNGIFVDEICSSILFTNDDTGASSEDSIDFSRTGHASLAAWDTDYRAGYATFVATLRASIPADWIIVDNCGPVGDRGLNGHMREHFPDQNGGTWTTNMLGWSAVAGDVGYLGDDDEYVEPINTVLLISRGDDAEDLPEQVELESQRLHRLILGSATLGEGLGIITGTENDISRGYLPWWADEFSVNPDGVAQPFNKTYQGWLGEPMGDYYVDPGGGYRRDFQGGSVLVNNQAAANRTFNLTTGVFYRIIGTICPTVNTGAQVDVVTLGPRDALFVQRRPPLAAP